MEQRPNLTMLRHFNKALKVEDISNFALNVNRSVDKETYFYQGVLHSQVIQEVNDHRNWMNKMMDYAEIEYKDYLYDFKYKFEFGKNIPKQKRIDNTDYSKVAKTSFDLESKKQNQNTLSKSYFNFEQINQNRRQARQYMFNQDKTPFSLRQIQMLGTKQFQQKFVKRSGYQEMVANQKLLDTKPPSYFQQEQPDGRPTLYKFLTTKGICFHLIKVQKAIKQGTQKRVNIQIDFLSLFQVHKKRLSYKEQFVPSNLYKQPVQFLHLIGFASGYYDLSILQIMIEERKKRLKITQRIQSENQLQVQITEIKNRIALLRKQKQQKKNKSISHMGTQIQKMIVDDPLMDLLFYNGEQAIKNIQNIQLIKQQKLKERISPAQVYKVLHPQLQKQLLALLVTLIQNQSFICISSFLALQDYQDIQDVILSAIDKNIQFLQGKRSKNGISKMQILRFYTQNKIKMKNQKLIIQNQQLQNKRIILKQNNALSKSPQTYKRQVNKSPIPQRHMMSHSFMANSQYQVSQRNISHSKSRHNSSVNADFSQKSRLKIEPDRMSNLARSVSKFRYSKPK